MIGFHIETKVSVELCNYYRDLPGWKNVKEKTFYSIPQSDTKDVPEKATVYLFLKQGSVSPA